MPQSINYFKTFSNSSFIQNSERLGTTKNRNLIVSSIKTKYFVFIDGDDFVNKEFVSGINSTIENENYDLVYFDYKCNDKQGKRYLVSMEAYTENGSLDIPRNLKKWLLLGCSVMKTEMVISSGMYRETEFEDLDLFLRLFSSGNIRTKYLPGVLYFWDNKSSGRNSNGKSQDFANVMIANYSTFKNYLHKNEINKMYSNTFNILINHKKFDIGFRFSVQNYLWFHIPRLIYHYVKFKLSNMNKI